MHFRLMQDTSLHFEKENFSGTGTSKLLNTLHKSSYIIFFWYTFLHFLCDRVFPVKEKNTFSPLRNNLLSWSYLFSETGI